MGGWLGQCPGPMRHLKVALRVISLAVLGFAVVGARPPEGSSRDRLPSEPAYLPNPDRVALQVDGWIIEVDRGLPANETGARVRKAVAALPRRRPVPPLSRYDSLIQWHAASHGLDWRLVAALIQEESGFKADAVSPKGAVGLMQVRPIAAEEVGEPSFASPNDNIRTGVRYLEHLQGMFAPAAEGRDRLALVLAAYNLGPAHVQDAQVLARLYGFDPHRWDNSMERILPLLEDPTFYRRLPAGYGQGRSTATYVERILSRYERFKVQAGESPGLAGPLLQAASANG